jgi:hypothetical protein
MRHAPLDARPAQKWLHRASTVLSGVLVVLAVPMVVLSIYALGSVLVSLPCDRAGHVGESDYCEDVGIGAGIGSVVGTTALVIGGSLLIGAAGLLLRPGLRGRVMLVIGSLVVGSPVVFFLALELIWIPLRE